MLRLVEQKIPGVFLIETTPQTDKRGSFARVFCTQVFKDKGIDFSIAQVNLSGNNKRYTLRGMHHHEGKHAEQKIVRVVRGRAYDVVVDLRRDRPTFGQWLSVELCALKKNAIYVPAGCAHGFLTLARDTEVLYQMGQPYVSGPHEKGFRWNDPAFRIHWPAQPRAMNWRDANYPDYTNS